ncbi:MAG: 3-isopropylmalate dehydratase [Nitrososphaerota archaeon]|nr:3-isopropylmalate dehydratase [Nitrososphaerota archaeon]MDG6966320.1 3-isopropylmalate dehydratase [Nitrososphaerota archaeon]MDG6977755.1 3-isopropylmalate dehydratase [Nitrososphaerota archaeon]MDG7006205.1 3-isopropylmalate dehydratase [Nitrososphaerota archaeon]MDG7020579.1 3-isopropylmalate dehydratase [Nitrososphaerota archaeon]
MQVRGKVAKRFDDDINTDYIIPAYLLQESWDKQFFADHAFEAYDPAFAPTCRANKESIVVARNNFGCGSSREQAVYAIKYNNVVAVVAQSFPDIFFRNCLNNGLLPIQVADTSTIGLGDELVIDLDTRKLKDLTTGQEHDIVATDASIETMKRGGFLGYVKERLRQRLNAQPPRAP